MLRNILILFRCISVSHSISAFASHGRIIQYPESITLRGGVVHAPPFAMVHDDGSYSGFQIDLIESLKIFALVKDNVQLNVELEAATSQYNLALDLVANDCNTTANPHPSEDCTKFDFIMGNYYANSDRSLLVDFSPAWLRSTISAIRSVNYNGTAISTLAQASGVNATICIKSGTLYSGMIVAKYPHASYEFCPSHSECIDLLKQDQCVLYLDDEVQLRYRQLNDPSVRMVKESFNTQYVVWPMSYHLDNTVSLLLKRWIHFAVNNATVDELYYKYFEKRTCPFGTAGKNCELFCDPDHGTSNVDGVCVCDSIRWTGKDCSVEVKENYNHIPPTLKALCYMMLGINILIVLSCAVWLFFHRSTRQVRISQPSFLLLVLLGCFLSSSTIGFLAYEDNGHYGSYYSNMACMAIPWTYSFGFSITFGTLYAKIVSVHRIFKSTPVSRRSSIVRRARAKGRETLSIIGAVLVLDIGVLITWTIVDPLQFKREVLTADKFGTPLSSVGYCVSDHWQTFSATIGMLHLCLLGVASYLCYKTRCISTELSQGRYVAIAMISNLQIFIVGVPVLVTVASDPEASFFIRCTIVWINDLMVVIAIFGSLIYYVHASEHSFFESEIMNRSGNSDVSSIRTFVNTEEVTLCTYVNSNELTSERPSITSRTSSQNSLINNCNSGNSGYSGNNGASLRFNGTPSLQKVSEVSKESESREMLKDFSREF